MSFTFKSQLLAPRTLGILLTGTGALGACDAIGMDGSAPVASHTAALAASGYVAPNCATKISVSTQADLDNKVFGCAAMTELTIDDPTGNITNLNSLTWIKSFGYCPDPNGPYANMPCEGGLKILNAPGVTALTGLSSLQYAYSLTITNTGASDFSGLGRLAYIHDMTVSDNTALTSMRGMTSLVSINGALSVSGNPVLPNMKGFEYLPTLSGMLRIDDNAAMTDLTGLDSLTSIGGALYVRENDALTSLTGLGGVTSIGGGGVTIYLNPVLANVDGLAALTTIGSGSLAVQSNDALTDVSGLIGVTQTADLTVTSNKSLTNVTTALKKATGTIKIESNAALTLIRMRSLTSIGGTLRIRKNTALTTTGFAALSTINLFNNLATKWNPSPTSSDLYIQDNTSYPTANATSLALQVNEGTANISGNK